MCGDDGDGVSRDEKLEGAESTHLLGLSARRNILLIAGLHELSVDKYMWHLYPKHHLLLHVCENVHSNPAVHWAYSDESEIGRAVDIADTMHPSHLHKQMVIQYCHTRPWIR